MNKLNIFTLFCLLATCSVLCAQEKKSKKERQQEHAKAVQQMVESQNYKFVAQYALPLVGKSISLTPDYNVLVSNDTINSYLPYYGRAYVAPSNPAEGGIKFISTHFDYSLAPAKKGGWTANMTMEDTKEGIRMILSITTTGFATLSVSDNTRQSISFNGYIEERKQ